MAIELNKVIIPPNQEILLTLVNKFLSLPDGFKPRAYMLTETNRARLYKFRMVINKEQKSFLVLSDNIRGLNPCKVAVVNGQVEVYLSDDMPFTFKDLQRFIITVYESIS